jgi:osmotically-inducible protein OsmY
MSTDNDIKLNIDAELRWSPELDEKDISTKVANGVVTLTGFVRSFYEKHQAETAAKRVAGVAAVANDIEVRLASGDGLTDPEIARNAAAVIKFQLPSTWESVKVLVKQGRITLEGEVPWNYQREGIESALRQLKGVLSVGNMIGIKPRVAPTEIKHRIEEAFRRSAEIDADRISVRADGSEVILSGTVVSWAERDQAQRTAWAAPGVTMVKNEIRVGL